MIGHVEGHLFFRADLLIVVFFFLGVHSSIGELLAEEAEGFVEYFELILFCFDEFFVLLDFAVPFDE